MTKLSGKAASADFCNSIKGLERRQKKVCRQHVEMMGSVMTGAKMSMEECQYQFKGRRWNCTLGHDSIFSSNVREGESVVTLRHYQRHQNLSHHVRYGVYEA